MACSKDFYTNEDENAVNGYCFELVEDDKSLECPICLLLLRQTMGTPCSHLFCLVCLQKLTSRKDIRGTRFMCPVCNNTVNSDQVYPIVYIDRCVRGSNVYCQQKKDFGCEWKGTVAEYYNKHENECECKIVMCKHEGCTASAMRKVLKNHEKCCQYRIVQCDHCKSEVKANKMENHFQSCENYPVICQENGCNAIIPKNEMEDHLLICNFVSVDCPYMTFGCSEKVIRINLEKHLELSVQPHMILASEKYCAVEKKLRETTKKLEKSVMEMEVIKNESAAKIKEIDKKQHLLISDVQNLKSENENQKMLIENLVGRISILEGKSSTQINNTHADNSNISSSASAIFNERLVKGKEVWMPAPVPATIINIQELLVKGSEKWLRKKEIEFDENDYAGWFKKVFDATVEKKLYRYDDVMYVKLKNDGNRIVWCSNTLRRQKQRVHSHGVIYNGKDGLVLKAVWKAGEDWSSILTGTFHNFKLTNCSCFILHPTQSQMILKMVEHTRERDHHVWKSATAVANDFHIDKIVIVCLIKNQSTG